MATFFNMYVRMHAIHELSGGQNMAGRSKKEKAAGREAIAESQEDEEETEEEP